MSHLLLSVSGSGCP